MRKMGSEFPKTCMDLSCLSHRLQMHHMWGLETFDQNGEERTFLLSGEGSQTCSPHGHQATPGSGPGPLPSVARGILEMVHWRTERKTLNSHPIRRWQSDVFPLGHSGPLGSSPCPGPSVVSSLGRCPLRDCSWKRGNGKSRGDSTRLAGAGVAGGKRTY